MLSHNEEFKTLPSLPNLTLGESKTIEVLENAWELNQKIANRIQNLGTNRTGHNIKLIYDDIEIELKNYLASKCKAIAGELFSTLLDIESAKFLHKNDLKKYLTAALRKAQAPALYYYLHELTQDQHLLLKQAEPSTPNLDVMLKLNKVMITLLCNINDIERSSIKKAEKPSKIYPLLIEYYNNFSELNSFLAKEFLQNRHKRKYVTDADVAAAMPLKKSRIDDEEKKPIAPGSTANLMKVFDPIPPKNSFVSRLIAPELIPPGQFLALHNLDQTVGGLQTILPRMEGNATKLLATILLLRPEEFALLRGTPAASEIVSKSYDSIQSPFLKYRTYRDFPAVAVAREEEIMAQGPRR